VDTFKLSFMVTKAKLIGCKPRRKENAVRNVQECWLFWTKPKTTNNELRPI